MHAGNIFFNNFLCINLDVVLGLSNSDSIVANIVGGAQFTYCILNDVDYYGMPKYCTYVFVYMVCSLPNVALKHADL